MENEKENPVNQPEETAKVDEKPEDQTTVESEQQTDASDPANTTEDQEVSTENSQVDTADAEPAESKPADESSAENETKKKPKTVWYGLIAAFVALFGGVGLLVALNGGDDTSQQPVASQVEQEPVAPVTTLGAEVALTEGVVEISRDGGETWVETPGSESVANLESIRTGDESRAVILFDDGSVARLDNNSEVYLSSLERDGLEMTLVKGQVYTRIVDSETTPFTVITANERFTSLGTAYKTTTDGEKDELEVYQSNVKVTSENVEVTEGNKYDTATKEQSAIDLEELQEDEFAQWNKEKDSESDDFKDKLGVLDEKPEEKEEESTQPESQSSEAEAGISLTAKQFDSGVTLSWSMSGATSTNGFKIVRDTSSSPTYGQDDAQYVGKSARTHKWWDDNGGTHYYRVCIYRENGTCDTYSNAVKATSPKVEKEAVKSGDITLTIDGKKLSWSLVGGTAPHGFKVVMSDDSGPVYPEDSELYIGAGQTEVTIPNPKKYIRVCKYTNGTQTEGCVDYSNEVEYVVSE